MTNPYKHAVSERLDDSKNITVGKARVIWASPYGSQPGAWVLPGGRRTTDAAEAMNCAARMDELIEGSSA